MSHSVRPALQRNFHRLAWFAMIMTASTIMFGAFVRLSDAGLSCPDWPTCYGQATWPQHVEETIGHPATEIRPLETHKAWREQVHRFLAGALGIEILTLALLATRRRRFGSTTVVTACVLVAAGIPLYMMGWHATASVLAIIGEAILLLAALRWSNIDLARAAVLTLAVVIFQALLGMWTVTWLLKPIVVMAHLLGGMLMFAMLVWMAWRATHLPITLAEAPKLKWLLRIGIAVLVAQIALGGWVSTNYAALACMDFPTCHGEWVPQMDFEGGYSLIRGLGMLPSGEMISQHALTAIHWTHRNFAFLVFAYLGALGWKMLREPGLRGPARLMLALLLAQLLTGLTTIFFQWPLLIAVLHNGGAAGLVLASVTLLLRLSRAQQTKIPA